jgi:hypothetical protein
MRVARMNNDQLTIKESVELRYLFFQRFNELDYLNYIGGNPVIVYGFIDDPIGRLYVPVVCSVLIKNYPASDTINFAEYDGKIRATDFHGGRIPLIVSHELPDSYKDFIIKRFSELEREGVIKKSDVIIITGNPYEHKRLTELEFSGNGRSTRQLLISF